jgi:hypothetical protein
MKPPTIGPAAGPRNGEIVKIIIGNSISFGSKRSATVPAATARKALPAKPSKNLPTIMVWMFCATAQGISQMRKKKSEPM